MISIHLCFLFTVATVCWEQREINQQYSVFAARFWAIKWMSCLLTWDRVPRLATPNGLQIGLQSIHSVAEIPRNNRSQDCEGPQAWTWRSDLFGDRVPEFAHAADAQWLWFEAGAVEQTLLAFVEEVLGRSYGNIQSTCRKSFRSLWDKYLYSDQSTCLNTTNG